MASLVFVETTPEKASPVRVGESLEISGSIDDTLGCEKKKKKKPCLSGAWRFPVALMTAI